MRITLLTGLLVTGLLALGGASASAATGGGIGAAVPILQASFGAPQIEVLEGDTVSWRNDSFLQHTVSAGDGSWSSRRLAAGAAFSHRFDASGTLVYYCQVHPFMRGEVDVQALLLDSPRQAAAPGRPFVLSGRSALPAGSTVSIEADGEPGGPLATATVVPGGGFRATVAPRATTSYRAVAGGEASRPVQVLVLDHNVTATARRRHGRLVVTARVLPAAPGATVVLQMRLRDRFGWWPVRQATVGRDSTVRFAVRRRRPVQARVVLTLDDGATPLAQSPAFRLGSR